MDSLIFIAYFNAVARIRNASVWICDARKQGFIQIWATRTIKVCGLKRTVSTYLSFNNPRSNTPQWRRKYKMRYIGRESADVLSGKLDHLEMIKSYD